MKNKNPAKTATKNLTCFLIFRTNATLFMIIGFYVFKGQLFFPDKTVIKPSIGRCISIQGKR